MICNCKKCVFHKGETECLLPKSENFQVTMNDRVISCLNNIKDENDLSAEGKKKLKSVRNMYRIRNDKEVARLPKEYQPKRNNSHYMNHNIYMQMKYLLENYPNLKEQRERLLYGSPAPADGLPKGNNIGNPTEQKALVLCTIDGQIKAIEQVIFELQAKYSKTYTGKPFNAYKAFLDYSEFCLYRSKRNKDTAPCKRTWQYYRSEFTYKLAKKLNYF